MSVWNFLPHMLFIVLNKKNYKKDLEVKNNYEKNNYSQYLLQ